MRFILCYVLAIGYHDKSWRMDLTQYCIRAPIHFITLGVTMGMAHWIIDRKIDRGSRAINHMILDRIKRLLPIAIMCDRGPFSVRLPRSLDDDTLWCKFTDRTLLCRSHAAEARLRSCSAPINLIRSMLIRGSRSFRPGRFPDVFRSHVAFSGQRQWCGSGAAKERRRCRLPVENFRVSIFFSVNHPFPPHNFPDEYMNHGSFSYEMLRCWPGAAETWLSIIGGQIRAHFFKSVHKSAKCAVGRKIAHFFDVL